MLATLVYLLSPALSVTALKSIVTASLDGVVRTLWMEVKNKDKQQPNQVRKEEAQHSPIHGRFLFYSFILFFF